ncbi:MAG: NAD(P)/FAD-dependent oxidoreductase [Akkermansia sp.]|nr:NAD(P)/FAD-dependent oxidoreductase [Akkermansia sp.]
MKKTVLIIGGGPAGLTAALELARKGWSNVTVLEREKQLGGISRTLEYQGNRIDIGGHRFFSKSDKVMQWWKDIMPLQGAPSCDDLLLNRSVSLTPYGPNPEKEDCVMLVRSRLSRILFLRRFFNYPVSLSADTLLNLGPVRVFKMGISYLWSLIRKRREKSLEDFFINRFGRELYKTFFRDYTAKVWGVPCNQIGADWGAQRVKGLSVTKVIAHALGKLVFWKKRNKQRGETSLIEEFWYPKYGPGQLWETVGAEAEKLGVRILREHDVTAVEVADGAVASLRIRNLVSGAEYAEEADYVISTTSVKELVRKMGESVPAAVKHVAEHLVYRDFMTVGILLDRLKLKSRNMNTSVGEYGVVPDNWIYVQESDVKVGRLQIFNNWSPYLVSDRSKVWVGMEYFVNEGDELWNMEDSAFCRFAACELEKIGVIDCADVVDSVVYRVQKAYPAYLGSYSEFGIIREWMDCIRNLYLVGRNGMHRYNNMDHSMVSAMEAVKNITTGIVTKANIWEVNTEKEYHESK